MILALSSSSPDVSVALIMGGSVLDSRSERAPQSASSILVTLAHSALRERGLTVADLSGVAVDLGPGGFTSTRVGVTFAKSLAWSLNLPVYTACSFDLIAPNETVSVPSKRGHWLVRDAGGTGFFETTDAPIGRGYGWEGNTEYPQAERFVSLLTKLPSADAMAVLPLYGSEPSISQPKDSRVLQGGG